jgi:alkylation response protein AidB-like acyl-CoA dehydrogenase
MLVHARRARLLAYRVIATQQTGQVRPGDTAAYRIAVTRLDQESAEVLMDIAGEIRATDDEAQRFRRAVEDHHRYSVSATVASGSIEMQRILLARSLLAAS